MRYCICLVIFKLVSFWSALLLYYDLLIWLFDLLLWSVNWACFNESTCLWSVCFERCTWRVIFYSSFMQLKSITYGTLACCYSTLQMQSRNASSQRFFFDNHKWKYFLDYFKWISEPWWALHIYSMVYFITHHLALRPFEIKLDERAKVAKLGWFRCSTTSFLFSD